MRFYKATAFLFPRSYERRVLFFCFGAVHIPLVACIVLQAVTGHWQLPTLLTLLAATLVGTGLGLAAINALLAPIGEATAMLAAIQNGERIVVVPAGGEDLVGRLLTGVTTAANETAARIEQLVDAAERDPLTGIRNRRGFLDSAEQVLRGRSNAVFAIIDIDHFKSINDQYGHDTGDQLLKSLARRIEDYLRRSDICARWGGEEFAVLLPDTTLDEARLVMERLRATVALDTGLGVEDRAVTFSCGLAPVRTFAQLGDATKQADAALYAAKNAGRNQVHVTGS
ncbi:GGDEF domain-containing protein [Novosphingobium sp. P6W]|uniref:GGDEF domain-containing protein n=1 Tax=Novosphingobium sp. P6W TaxID=1609758 RepID=UPI0005C2BABB|nr:GGDEF domain-containing protein [Novosphingobium sp. P6W]AXB75687.1 GGDEF domain-containing protein [Novosphingobium sp. P6W]KIS33089.1 response regulator PleD [Novosphingobium sp. P6W]